MSLDLSQITAAIRDALCNQDEVLATYTLIRIDVPS